MKQILTGVVPPTTQGDDGDLYIDSVEHKLWLKIAGTWAIEGVYSAAGPRESYGVWMDN